jgi:hypothetical protein
MTPVEHISRAEQLLLQADRMAHTEQAKNISAVAVAHAAVASAQLHSASPTQSAPPATRRWD